MPPPQQWNKVRITTTGRRTRASLREKRIVMIFLISVGLLLLFLLLLVFQCLSVLLNETVETAILAIIAYAGGFFIIACAQLVHEGIAAKDGGGIILGIILAAIVLGVLIPILGYLFMIVCEIVIALAAAFGTAAEVIVDACEVGFCRLIVCMERSVEKKGARRR